MVISWDAVHCPAGNLLLTFGPVMLVAAIVSFFAARTRKARFGVGMIAISAVIWFVVTLGSLVIGPWQVLAEGTYHYSKHYRTDHITSTGAPYSIDHLIVFFQDAREYPLNGVIRIPYVRGTRIQILTKNGLYKIEEVPASP